MAKHKKRKPKHRPRSRIQHWWRKTKVRVARRWDKLMGPKVIANAKTSFSADGENLTPKIQPPTYRQYVAPEDLELYLAVIGGLEVEFELLPEEDSTLETAAYRAATELHGVYIESQPIEALYALNHAASEVLATNPPTQGAISVHLYA